MKLLALLLLMTLPMSPPSRGAWIEISRRQMQSGLLRSTPSRGAWIEMSEQMYCRNLQNKSPPSRGAWIEIIV